jgi:predicted membrane protein
MKTKADEFSQDWVVTSLIYILIFAFGYMLNFQYQLDKQKLETIKAQKVAVELHEEKKVVEDRLDIAHENLGSLNSELDKYEKAETTIQKVIKELP